MRMRERAGGREGEGREREMERSACGMYEEARGRKRQGRMRGQKGSEGRK
jgi:hypothetical protein